MRSDQAQGNRGASTHKLGPSRALYSRCRQGGDLKSCVLAPLIVLLGARRHAVVGFGKALDRENRRGGPALVSDFRQSTRDF